MNKKGFALILILVILVAVGVAATAGLYLVTQNPSSKSTTSATTNPTTTNTTSTKSIDTTKVEVNTSGWESYKNDLYSFKYPKNWKVVDVLVIEPESFVVVTTPENAIELENAIESAKAGQSGECFPSEPIDITVVSGKASRAEHESNAQVMKRRTYVSGVASDDYLIHWNDICSENLKEIDTRNIFTEANDKTFIFHLNDLNVLEDVQVFEGILSTFKFTQ